MARLPILLVVLLIPIRAVADGPDVPENVKQFFKRELEATEAHRAEIQPDIDRLEQELALARRGTMIVAFKRRLDDGTVVLADGSSVSFVIEGKGKSQRIRFCDQAHKKAYIKEHEEEIAHQKEGLNGRVTIYLNPIANLDKGRIGLPAPVFAYKVLSIVSDDIMLVAVEHGDHADPLWVGGFPTKGLTSGSYVKLGAFFEVVDPIAYQSRGGETEAKAIRRIDVEKYRAAAK